MVGGDESVGGAVVLLSKLRERITTVLNATDLGVNRFPGTVHSRGFQYSFIRAKSLSRLQVLPRVSDS
jgi:hypothetical protein